MTSYFGKYTGIVQDNRDARQHGRLKVTVPAVFHGDVVTARAALPYGFFFVPENDTKVWVEFEGGDSRLPLWTGVQYLPEEWAEEAAENPPQKRVIKTPSGHVIVFNDIEGEESIEITDGVNSHVITLNADGISISDGVNSHTVTLTSDGVTLSGSDGGSVTVSDGVQAQSSSGASLEVGSTVSAQVASGAKIEITDGQVTIDAGAGVLSLAGSMITLNNGALPIVRLTDQGVGNMGAPVPIVIGPGNPTVLG